MARRVTGVVSVAVVRDLLTRKGAAVAGSSGVLGIKARPEWPNGPLMFAGGSVPVSPCPSSLAVREALLQRNPDGWLVILTDRDDDDLGLGITAHLVGRRLQNPDPWDAVKHGFEATRIDSQLATADHRTDLAMALLNATPDTGWPAARGGILTFDHVMESVAAAHLDLPTAGDGLDLATVLEWTLQSDVPRHMTALAARSGPLLADLAAGWVAHHAGVLAPAVRPALIGGSAADLVPLGLVARAVEASEPGSGPRALFRQRASATVPLALWADAAESTIGGLIVHGDATREQARAALHRADQLLDQVEAGSLASSSAVLRASLSQRLAALGEGLRVAVGGAPVRASSDGPDSTLVDAGALAKIESAWAAVTGHVLADRVGEVRVPRARAGVQLVRWLSAPVENATDFPAVVDRFWQVDAWVDRAVNDATSGVDIEELAQGLRAVLAAVRLRRDSHDTSFAALAVSDAVDGSPLPRGVTYAEDLLASVVFPLARSQGVLFVLADGMSGGVATEIVDDVTTQMDTWLECLPDGATGRLAAIAAFPTLTRVSRASLFCGDLATGEQRVELVGFASLTKAHGLNGRLFHKLALDSSEPGFAIAHDVAAAVDDESVNVVACVLNTIDDALDRSDPAGIEWSAESVKHLRPLLDRARRAGRVVVIASDHGHVIERRNGRFESATSVSSNRSFAYGGAVPAGAIRATGKRVLEHNGDAVLAVDERIRFGPIKAGYHGGAAPAEVVIPVLVLANGQAPLGWEFAPPQSPAWWRGPRAVSLPANVEAPRKSKPEASEAQGSLFEPAPQSSSGLVAQLFASPVWAEQVSRSTNRRVTDEQIARLVDALLAAPGNRLDAEAAAAALAVAVVRLAGALPQVQRLLNVEQYEVIGRDSDGTSVVLDVALLCEQFGVSG